MEEKHSNLAASLYASGYNCGQAVVIPFADRYGITKEQASKICAAFGGGLARQRMTCGAVLGLAVLAGMEEGNSTTDEKEKIRTTMALAQDFIAQYKKMFGSVICGEILGLPGYEKANGPGHDIPIPECFKGRPCAIKVQLAAEIFERYINKTMLANK